MEGKHDHRPHADLQEARLGEKSTRQSIVSLRRLHQEKQVRGKITVKVREMMLLLEAEDRQGCLADGGPLQPSVGNGAIGFQ